MITKGIVGRLTKQLVEEAHPTVDSSCCINEIQQKKHCGLCKVSCHVSALDKITSPDFTHCDDCGICVAHCPAQVFTNSPSLTQKLITLVENTNQTITLSCHHSQKEADCKLSCLAAYPWEVLASLVVNNNLISFVPGECDSCPHKTQMLLFERSLSQLKSFLGEEAYKTIFSENQKPQLQSRREAFSSLLRQGGRSALNLLPEELRSSPDKNLWRKVLLHSLASQNPSKHTAHWITPIIQEDCKACGICEKLCPNKALRIVLGEDKEFYLTHFSWKCQGCGLCAAACPWKCITEFGRVALEPAHRPVVTKTKAKVCSHCSNPAYGELELCIECSIKQREGNLK